MTKTSPERLAYLKAWRKPRQDALAIAAGREPGRIGRPPVLVTEELAREREEKRIARNKRSQLASHLKRSAKRAERALADGRIPGRPGKKKTLTTPELVKESQNKRQAKYRETHRDELRANGRARSGPKWDKLRTERPDEYKVITIANAAKQRALNDGIKTPRGLTAIVRELWQQCEGKCAVCGSDEDPELDHILAVANGGTNAKENLQFLCKPCNRSKGKKDFETWLAGRADLERIAA